MPMIRMYVGAKWAVVAAEWHSALVVWEHCRVSRIGPTSNTILFRLSHVLN
jgi:hypothetical protein